LKEIISKYIPDPRTDNWVETRERWSRR